MDHLMGLHDFLFSDFVIHFSSSILDYPFLYAYHFHFYFHFLHTLPPTSSSIKDKEALFESNGKRYLTAPRRASCKGCKSKIDKGKLHYGSSQEGIQHGSIFWTCLPCVTSAQLAHAHETYGSTPGNYSTLSGVSLFDGTDTALVVDAFCKAEGVPP
jgi:hypothetical protein